MIFFMKCRWMLAVTSVSFTSHVIKDRARFASMASVQLPFGQLPLLQIDNLEIVQSQACRAMFEILDPI
jgi:hypothetical protein